MNLAFRGVCVAAGIGLAFGVASCRSSSEPSRPLPGHCANLDGDELVALLGEYPLDRLADDVRADLGEALRGTGRVCLAADGEAASCNAGGGPKPDVRRCCRFSTEPRAEVSGVPRRIAISRGGAAIVDLVLDPGLLNASIDRQCDVPTCDDDRVSATASLLLTGTVATAEGAVEFELPVTLDPRVALRCEG